MLKLVIANKLYSSWSMRPWLVMTAFNIPFDEVVLPLRRPETAERLAVYSPTGKVPVLVEDSGLAIWDSLAIIEYLAESHPELSIWPNDRAMRAHARSIANEMHSGFMPLRQGCPMNLGGKFQTPELSEALRANVDRIEAIWAEPRTKFNSAGPYLYGAFSAADAMFAPVVTRFDSYQIPVKRETRAYMDVILAHPSMVAWRNAALKEKWTIADYGAGHTLIETYRQTDVAR